MPGYAKRDLALIFPPFERGGETIRVKAGTRLQFIKGGGGGWIVPPEVLPPAQRTRLAHDLRHRYIWVRPEDVQERVEPVRDGP